MSKQIITFLFFMLIAVSSVFAQDDIEMQIAGRMFVNWSTAEEMEVVVREDFAFVALDPGGIHILDISNPRNPQIVWYNDTDFPCAKSPVIFENYLIFIATEDVVVLDISDPTLPSITYRHLEQGRWHDRIVATSFGVAIGGYGGSVDLFNMNDMGQLIEVGRINSSAWNITVDNNILYAVGRHDIDEENHTRVIRAIDIVDPTNPHEISWVAIDRTVIDICARDGIIYTALERDGVLRILDATNPDEMQELYHGGNWGEPTSITLAGQLLLMTTTGGFINIIDISQPTESVLLSSYRHGTHGLDALDVSAQGTCAFVVGDTRLGMVDFSNPEIPAAIGEYNGNGNVESVMSLGRYALVQDREGNPRDDYAVINIVDVEDIHQPLQMGQCDVTGEAYNPVDMCVKNNFLFVLKPYGCDIFNILNVNRPVLVASWENEDHEDGGDHLIYYGIESTDGDYIFLRTNQGFESVRASQLPRLVRRSINIPEGENAFTSFKIYDNYAFCLDALGMRVLDISDRNNVHTVALCNLVIYGMGIFNLSMNPEGDLVVMTDWKNCWLFDVSDPLNPEILTEDLSAPKGASIYGDYLLANSYESLTLYDISNRTEPVVLTEYQTPGLLIESIELCDGYALIGDGTSFMILEIVQPEKVGDPVRLVPSINNLEAYPNPFNSTTIVNYSLPTSENLSIRLFDISGRELRTLYHGFQTSGSHSIVLDGTYLAAGSYLIGIEGEEFSSSRKVELIK